MYTLRAQFSKDLNLIALEVITMRTYMWFTHVLNSQVFPFYNRPQRSTDWLQQPIHWFSTQCRGHLENMKTQLKFLPGSRFWRRINSHFAWTVILNFIRIPQWIGRYLACQEFFECLVHILRPQETVFLKNLQKFLQMKKCAFWNIYQVKQW